MIDSIYTPPDLAAKIVRCIKVRTPPKVIADFAAGDGQLLRAAERKWKRCRFVAVDIDLAAVRKLRNQKKSWWIGRGDFLKTKSRSHIPFLPNLEGGISVVILNPPFSCRGAKTILTNLGDKILRTSIAMAFVVSALRYLGNGGQLIAILPSGCLQSQKDDVAWQAIRETCRVEVLGQHGHKTFSGWTPKTSIVRITKRSRRVRVRSEHQRQTMVDSSSSAAVKLFRGRISMHTLNGYKVKSPIPLVHTTELRPEGIDVGRRFLDKSQTSNKTISGPSVLLQRVGSPDFRKIQLYLSKDPIALSDCVIGLKCDTAQDAIVVKDSLVREWGRLESKFSGTCAKYITLRRLNELLIALGIRTVS